MSSQNRNTTLFGFNLERTTLFRMKTMLLVKPVQTPSNRGMVLIRNDYVKTFSVRFTLILIGLSHILSWQDCFMSWIRILIACSVLFVKQIDQHSLFLSNLIIIHCQMNDVDQSQSILFAQFAITNYEFYYQLIDPVMILFELIFAPF
jgi:hypothetical protein